MVGNQTSPNRSEGVKLLFVGQCLMTGHKDVDPALTFVGQAVSRISEQYPHLDIKLGRKHLHHPKGLKAILKHRLAFARPDVFVISTIASFAALHTRVNLIYEMAPEVLDTAKSFMRKIENAVSGTPGKHRPETAIDKLIGYRPPLAISEYEEIIREGVKLCQKSGVRAVLVGPGRFNEDVKDNYSIPSGQLPSVFSEVNEMAKRVGRELNVPVIDAQGALDQFSGEVFLRDNIRWSRFGHEVVARELERVLASEIVALSMTGAEAAHRL
jgi:hypothetical protein